ncbi:MAG: hypothetical protein J7494_08450 [Sphingobium sp.]|nr:hypothetical protein [Sphingobium sp.]
MTMAYLDLADPAPAASAQLFFAPVRPIEETVAEFSRREWTIIRLAREDGLSSLREESEFKEFLRLVFGFERKRPLSSPRLEALRRVAVLGWHYGHNIAGSELSAFFAAGYSPDHYDVLLAHIGAERAASAKRTRR